VGLHGLETGQEPDSILFTMGTNNLLLEEAQKYFKLQRQKYFKLQRQEELSKLKERIQIVDATPTIAL
jgi:hypothetical protein